MEFKKKLKVRLITAIVYLALGAVLIAIPFLIDIDNEYLSAFGLALVVCGAVRLRNHLLVTKNEDTIRKQEIAETDERNIHIARKAKSIAFSCCLMLTCVAVIVLECLHMELLATAIGTVVCAQLVFYWMTYWILQKRS